MFQVDGAMVGELYDIGEKLWAQRVNRWNVPFVFFPSYSRAARCSFYP